MPAWISCRQRASAMYFFAIAIYMCGGHDSSARPWEMMAARKPRNTKHCCTRSHAFGILHLRGGMGDVAMMDSSGATRTTLEGMTTPELRAELGKLGLDTLGARTLLLIRLERAIRETIGGVIPQKTPQQQETFHSPTQAPGIQEGDISMEVDTGETKRHGPRRQVRNPCHTFLTVMRAILTFFHRRREAIMQQTEDATGHLQ
jgi:hypothetical protein